MTEQEDYQRLRETASRLLARIEENQQIQARFHDYEFQLLACRRLPELLRQLFDAALGHFDLAAVSLTLYDPDYAIASLLEHLDLGDFDGRLKLQHAPEFFDLMFQREQDQREPNQPEPKVKLGELDASVSARLFPVGDGIRSVALLPLMRQDNLIGSLHFASDSRERYSADKGVNFMWHLASMVAVCLENCIALEQLQRQGQEDTLTQVRTRRCFDGELEKSWSVLNVGRNLCPVCLWISITSKALTMPTAIRLVTDVYGRWLSKLRESCGRRICSPVMAGKNLQLCCRAVRRTWHSVRRSGYDWR